MKTALVTGSSGFVGRHMVAELLRRSYHVTCVDLQIRLDALDFFRQSKNVYDLVVHCAYHVGGRAAIEYEPRMLALNLQLDSAMFDWAVRTKQNHVLYFSSSAAYPVRYQSEGSRFLLGEDIIGFKQYDLEHPDADYGWAKLTGERLARNARAEGISVSIVRPFSGYGSDQSNDYPFGAFLSRALNESDPFEIWGSGAQVRDWIHIDDVINGALKIVDSNIDAPVNLCTGMGTSMLELAYMICKEVGYEPEYQTFPDAPHGVNYRVGSPAFLNNFYTPKISIEEGVARSVAERKKAHEAK